MATKKRTSASGRTSKAAATRKKNEQGRRAHRQMQAIILFAVGIFVAALSVIPGTSLWNGLHNVLYAVFGWGSILIAVLILYLAGLLSADKPVRGRAWMGAFFIISVCGALQIFQMGVPLSFTSGKPLIETITECAVSGVKGESGGLCGTLVGLPLLLSFGKLGAGITIVLLIFVFAMLLTGGTLIGLLRAAKKPVDKIEESYLEQMEIAEQRRNERAERQAARQRKPSIDIELDEPKPARKAKKAEPAAKPIIHGHVSEAQVGEEAAIRDHRGDFNIDISIDDDFVPEETGGFSLIPAGEEPIEASLEALVNKAAAAEPQAVSLPAPEEFPSVQKPLSEKERGKPDDSIQAELAQTTEALPQVPVYVKPSVGLLTEPRRRNDNDITEEMKANAQRLVDTLASFGVQTRIVDIARGPAVTRYELQPSAGVKISKITGLADDIALNLASAGVRIEAPIPNKAAVGIEVPNKVVSSVTLREIIDSDEFAKSQSKLSVAMGRDIAGNIVVADLAKMPHLLIAGSTGSGKSVCINSIIMSLLFKSTPEEVRLLMVDPKVVELGIYNGIPQLLVPVVTDPKKAAGALSWAVTEMLKRYKLFAENSVRDLASYNKLAERSEELEKMPQIVIVIDELADLMMAAPSEIEDYICRLAQMARAAGMHLIIATQRPSVDVITGVIKANIASRVAFAVSSQVDSRTILDMGGAEKLLGRGDMLFNPVGAAKPIRVQGCFVTDQEIENVISFIKNDATADYDEKIASEIDNHVVATKGGKAAGNGGGADSDGDTDDEMLIPAIECVVEAGMASTSLLQRRLKLGYARAARIVDAMESRGIVGPFEGSKPRQVLVSPERWAEMKMNMMD